MPVLCDQPADTSGRITIGSDWESWPSDGLTEQIGSDYLGLEFAMDFEPLPDCSRSRTGAVLYLCGAQSHLNTVDSDWRVPSDLSGVRDAPVSSQANVADVPALAQIGSDDIVTGIAVHNPAAAGLGTKRDTDFVRAMTRDEMVEYFNIPRDQAAEILRTTLTHTVDLPMLKPLVDAFSNKQPHNQASV